MFHSTIGRILPTLQCSCPNPGTCEHITLYGKEELREFID